MIDLKIGRNTDLYFDRDAIIRAMDKATNKAFGKAGAFIMRSAQKSIKNGTVKAKGRVKPGEERKTTIRVSKPGQPPYSQTGLLRDHIEFYADRASLNQNLLVGPVKLSGGSDAPHVLEFGGMVERSDALPSQFQNAANGSKVVQRKRGEKRRVKVEARPFMGPALAKEAPTLPAQFRSAAVRS